MNHENLRIVNQHTAEDRCSLERGTPEFFARTTVRMRAVQNLSLLYPCTSATDDIAITVESKRHTDALGRSEMVGRAWAFCSAPDTCPSTRKAQP